MSSNFTDDRRLLNLRDKGSGGDSGEENGNNKTMSTKIRQLLSPPTQSKLPHPLHNLPKHPPNRQHHPPNSLYPPSPKNVFVSPDPCNSYNPTSVLPAKE
jgi:hypothetical protein